MQSPVSAATAIKNILNSTKNVGSGTSNSTSNATYNTNTVSGIGQGQYNAVASTIALTAASSAALSPSQTASAITTNSSSVTQTIVSGISISLGIGNASNNNNKLHRNNGSNITQIKFQNSNIGEALPNGYENNSDNTETDSKSINNSDGSASNGSEPFVTQTLQQISGSPGRARDRNIFHTPTAAVQLPLLRGFYQFNS